jgi:hypothetical protein
VRYQTALRPEAFELVSFTIQALFAPLQPTRATAFCKSDRLNHLNRSDRLNRPSPLPLAPLPVIGCPGPAELVGGQLFHPQLVLQTLEDAPHGLSSKRATVLVHEDLLDRRISWPNHVRDQLAGTGAGVRLFRRRPFLSPFRQVTLETMESTGDALRLILDQLGENTLHQLESA